MAKHGRYNIVRRVADGGMAEIFLATQVGRDGFQKPVILKRIHSTIYADPQFRNMFIDEAHISMSLAHSNIAQVLDLGVGARAATSWCWSWSTAGTWDACCSAPPPRARRCRASSASTSPPTSAARWPTRTARPTASGRSGIVHRDISPHNVLLSEQGEIKLTDFGIAKAMNKREQTGTGVVKGKVAFMSPEQAMGKPIDARSDLFSLGTVLYLLMVRSRPFEGPTDLETLLRVQKGDFTPPEAAAPDLEPEVAAIINRAMQARPQRSATRAPTRCWPTSSTCCARVFRPVGQTELKRWLAELSAHDGHAVDRQGARARARPPAAPGTGELDGKDVVLSDSQELRRRRGHRRRGGDVAGGRRGGGGGGRMRLSRQRARERRSRRCPCRATPRPIMDGRASQELAPADPRDRGAARTPARAQRRRLLQGAAVRRACWSAAPGSAASTTAHWFAGERRAGRAARARRERERPSRGAKPSRAAARPRPKPPRRGPTQRPSRRRAQAADAGAPATRTPQRQGSDGRRAGRARKARAATPASRASRATGRPRERAKENDAQRPTAIDLKSMMAPDPSQLPPRRRAPARRRRPPSPRRAQPSARSQPRAST